MKTIIIAAAAALLATGGAFAQTPKTDLGTGPALEGPPATLLPERVGGAVVYVRDLEAQRQWYETMLGFKVVNTYSRNGQVFEYIMNTGDQMGGFMGIARNDARPNGYNTNARVVLPVPDPRALASFFASKGVFVREAVPGSAYLILDPEGNQVELYRLSTPRPAGG